MVRARRNPSPLELINDRTPRRFAEVHESPEAVCTPPLKTLSSLWPGLGNKV